MQGESSEDKRERLRQRAAAERERTMAAQSTAQDLDTDLASVYGRGPSMADLIGVPVKPKKPMANANPMTSNPIGR
jgi:hypothetical protein